MSSAPGTLLWLGYGLNRHKVGALPLSGLGLIGGALVWGGAWRGWLSLVQAAAISLVCWALAGTGLWALCRGYLRFRSETMSPPVDVSGPPPDERVSLRASGRFEVVHKKRDFVGAQAAFSTMDSGEHVIMAHIPRSRLLLLGQWPTGEVGWWYIFLSPGSLEAITPGELLFGPRARPALKVRYRSDRGEVLTVYLDFASSEERGRVWAGLNRA